MSASSSYRARLFESSRHHGAGEAGGYLSTRTRDALGKWLDASGIKSGPVFQGLHARKLSGKPLSTSAILRLVKRAAMRAQLDRSEAEGKSRALIAAAVAAGAPHFIFSSTAATYGIPDVPAVSEDTPQRPINPYGWSKLMTKQMLADVAAAHPLNFGVLRYFNVAGADPQARSGQSTAGATHLIKVAIEAALGMREAVSVFGTDYATPDGTGVRDYIHVSDLAAAQLLTLEALLDEPQRSLTMNCGYGRGFSVLEVLDAVDRVKNRKLDRRIEGRRAGDPDALISDPSRLKATLGWVPAHADLDTIITHALAWERKLGGVDKLVDLATDG